jgi:hypothetical protein
MGIDYDSDDNDPKLNGTNIWCRFEQHRGQPVRAIVKDLVTDEGSERWPGAFEVKQIPEIWSDLKALHELGILVRDLHIGNYLRGKLADFSRAWTMYHPCLDENRVGPSGRRSLSTREARELQGMIDDSFGYDVEEVPDDLHECAAGEINGPNPTGYNWRERGGEEAEAHVQELYTEHGSHSEDDD